MRKKEQTLEESIRETMRIVRENKNRTAFDADDDIVFDASVNRRSIKDVLKEHIPWRGDTIPQIILKVVIFVAEVVFLISAYKLTVYFVEQYQAEVTQHIMRHYYTVASQRIDMSVPKKNDLQMGVKPLKELVLREAAKELLEINKDTVGYIQIPQTMVSGVVVQGEDNEYYLDRDVYQNKKQCGTLFVDSRARIGTYYDSPNLIIYGHNQKDGTMFGTLDYYKWNTEYWKTSPIIYFDTNYEQNAYLIIASFVTNERPEDDNGNVFDYWNYIYFNDDFPFETWKKEVLTRTQFYTNYDFDVNDEYITLSTCATEWEPSRHVIIARKLRSNETVEDIDVSKWEENPNPRYPQIWYDNYGGESWEEGEAV